jgi:L-rhamnose mutarotase
MKNGVVIIIFIHLCLFNETKGQAFTALKIVETTEIDSVWVANNVSFDIKTVGQLQYVAYYNKERLMTVATRNINSKLWVKKVLDNKLKWDSHNYVELGIDDKGYIHISGNMHNDTLIYYRSQKPHDIQSIVPLNYMVGKEENSVTYPAFFNDKNNQLFFTYRIGSSGKGKALVNKFDSNNSTWQRFINEPLFDGLDSNNDRSAYFQFTNDKAGVFHYVWMWRWSPLVESCHQLSYAKSADLLNWQNAAGAEIVLPIKPDNKKLIIDDVPTKGGLHNGRYKIFITQDQKVVIGYIKYDDKGNTQLYFSKFEKNKWIIKKISNWNFRWEFKGGGDQMTIGANFNFEGFSKEGYMAISWKNEKSEKGQFVIDPKTFKIVTKKVTINNMVPKALYDRITTNQALSVITKEEKSAINKNERYILKWEAMPKSHGKNAPSVIPAGPISVLQLVKVQ